MIRCPTCHKSTMAKYRINQSEMLKLGCGHTVDSETHAKLAQERRKRDVEAVAKRRATATDPATITALLFDPKRGHRARQALRDELQSRHHVAVTDAQIVTALHKVVGQPIKPKAKPRKRVGADAAA
jgi:hypothetical protein